MDKDKIKYDTDFLCTYQLINTSEIDNRDIREESEESENTKSHDDISDLCYQKQILQVFGIEEYDSGKIGTIMDSIYDEIKGATGFVQMMGNIREKMYKQLIFFTQSLQSSGDFTDRDIFVFVIGYEYFHLFHNQYCAFKNNRDYDFGLVG